MKPTPTWRSPLLWAAGAEFGWITNRAERARLTCAGGIVCLTALAGAAAMVLLLSTVLGGFRAYFVAVGSTWGLVVFMIDRWITATIDYGNLEPGERPRHWWNKIGYFGGRLLLAGVIGLLIAEPIILGIFRDDIADEIDKIHSGQIKQLNDTVPQEASFVQQSMAIEAALTAAQINQKDSSVAESNAYGDWQAELHGTGGTGDVGNGPEAYTAQGIYNRKRDARIDADGILAAAITKHAQDQAELSRLIAGEIDRRAATIRDDGGLLIREEALEHVLTDNPRLQLVRWFLTGALLLVDLMPALLKMTSGRTLYERIGRVEAMRQTYGAIASIQYDRDLALHDAQDRLAAREQKSLITQWHRNTDLAAAEEKAALASHALAAVGGAAREVMTADADPGALVDEYLDEARTQLSKRRGAYPPPDFATPPPASTADVGESVSHKEFPITAPQPETSVVDVGSVVAGQYFLDERVHTSDESAVFRAHHVAEDFDFDFAVKIYWAANERGGAVLRAAMAEAHAIPVGIGHENHAHIYYVNTSGRDVVVVTKMFPWTLQTYIEQLPLLTLGETFDLAEQVFNGLVAAWTLPEPRTHLDIKPTNIGVDDDAAHTLKIFDWGLSKLAHGRDALATERPTFTNYFSPPEQRTRQRPEWGSYLLHADLYAFAATWYWMVVGEAPHRREAIRIGLEQHGNVPNGKALTEFVAHTPPTRLSKYTLVPETFDRLISQWLCADPPQRNPGPGDTSAFIERLRLNMAEIKDVLLDARYCDLPVGNLGAQADLARTVDGDQHYPDGAETSTHRLGDPAPHLGGGQTLTPQHIDTESPTWRHDL
nr:DUF4407 domain-containing protein [Mycobacterium sp. BK086]